MRRTIYVISDLHYGHKIMAIRRGFNSVEEHDQYIINQWNSVVNKHDTVWILGDITMEKDNYSFLDKLKGYKKVVLGNHDLPQHIPSLMSHVNCVCGMYTKIEGVILSHAPIHASELYDKINVHGHIHDLDIQMDYQLSDGENLYFANPDYINVCCEKIDFKPIKLKELIDN